MEFKKLQEEFDIKELPPSKPNRVINVGLLWLFLIFVVLLGWAAFTPLATSSVATGKVIPSTATVPIQHLSGGVIEKIYVKDGDSVDINQSILKLRDIELKEQLNILRNQYQDLLAKQDRLSAQIANKDNIEFSKEITKQSIINSQQNIFDNSKKSIKEQSEITKNRVSQFNKEIISLKSQLDSKIKRLESISSEITELEGLFKEQLIGKQRLRDKKREKDILLADIDSLKADISKTKDKIIEANKNFEIYKKNLKQDWLKEYANTKSKVSDTKSKIIALEDKLSRVLITSPIKGIVMGMDKHSINEVIKPGETVCEIIPANAKLIIEVLVNPADIDKVKVGLDSILNFPSLDMKNLPDIYGKVIYVSANSQSDKNSKMSYYIARIEISKEGLEVLKKHNLPLIVGMPAVAMIRTGERTMLDYLIKPLKEMVQRGFNEE